MNVVVGGSSAAASSECSSECESGWTLYLEHSSSFGRNSNKVKRMASFYEEQGKKISGLYNDEDHNVAEEEEEDLSMVSDASSGPPHFDHDIDEDDDDEEVEEVFCYGGKRKRRIDLSTHHYHHRHQCFKTQDFALDDTASSPIFTSKKNGDNKSSSLKRMIDYSSQGFSTNHFYQGRSSNFQERYGFIQSPLSTKQFKQNQWS